MERTTETPPRRRPAERLARFSPVPHCRAAGSLAQARPGSLASGGVRWPIHGTRARARNVGQIQVRLTEPLGHFSARMTVMESYVERLPWPGLAGVVRTVWIQRTGEAADVQRHLPPGGGGHPFPVGRH